MNKFNELFDLLIERTASDLHGVDIDDTVIGQLLPYVEDKNVLIHFTELLKLGNNPQSPFNNTPQGIYFYPLAWIWKEFMSYYPDFTLENHNIDRKKPLKDRKYKFTSPRVIPFKPDFTYILVARIKPGANILNFGKDVPGYEGYIDKLQKYLKMDISDIIEEVESDGDVDSDDQLSMLYGITKNISEKYYKKFGFSKSIVMWNVLFNKAMGINGLIDNGFGYIHPAEHTQTVIFSAANIDHIDTILNKENPNSKTTMKDLIKNGVLEDDKPKYKAIEPLANDKLPIKTSGQFPTQLNLPPIEAITDKQRQITRKIRMATLKDDKFGERLQIIAYMVNIKIDGKKLANQIKDNIKTFLSQEDDPSFNQGYDPAYDVSWQARYLYDLYILNFLNPIIVK